MCVYAHVDVCMYVCVHACLCVYLFVCMCVCLCVLRVDEREVTKLWRDQGGQEALLLM